LNESKIKTNPFKSTRKKIADIDSGMNMFSNLHSKQFASKNCNESISNSFRIKLWEGTPNIPILNTSETKSIFNVSNKDQNAI